MFKRNCVVKYLDNFGVEHAAKVEAESLFEAAVRGLHRLDSSFLVVGWRGEETMPHYEYLCQACNKKFSLAPTVAEHDKGKIKCPKCGSSNVEQQWAAFYATTSKKN